VRIAFSTLAFPGTTLASAVSLGRRWGYAGVELRLIDGELTAQVYANLGRRILLTQIKDARRGPDDDWRLVLLGEGEVPVRQMLALLAAGGYPHWISVEWEKRWHPGIEGPEIALPQHLPVLATWTEVMR